MKKIILVHTVASLVESFPKWIRETIDEDIQIENILDEFLANEPFRTGEITNANINEFFHIMKAAELSDPDLIVVTCSTLSPLVKTVEPFINKKIIAIDDAMCREVANRYHKILLIATAESAIQPTKEKILTEAGEKNLNIDTVYIDKAINHLKQGNKDEHDKIVIEKTQEYKNTNYDAIVLCQASLAHLESDIQKILNIPVFSAPQMCIKQIEQELRKK